MTTPAANLLSKRPHTSLPADNSGDDDGDDYDYFDVSQPSSEQQDQNAELLEDAAEDEMSLTDFQRHWQRLKTGMERTLETQWRAGGPNLDTALNCATVVRAAQETGSNLAQLYAARGLGVKFKPFLPNDSILERPGASKLQVYSRPMRENSMGQQLKRLDTLASTDLQLAKTRTLFSAFDEDMTVNRAPVQAYRRDTSSENPCALCEIAATQLYFTTDLMPIHDNCMCDVILADVDEISEHELHYHHLGFVKKLLDTGEQKKDIQALADADADLDDYVNLTKIEQHGELGPVIRWAGQKFTGPGDLPDPKGIRPVPTVSGPGAGHEGRVAANRERMEQIRRQRGHSLHYAEGHGGMSTYVPPRPKRSAVDQLAELTSPKPNWTSHDLAKEDNHATNAAGKEILTDEDRALARQLATDVWTKGAKVEPTISAAAKASAESLGGFMSGWDFRQKTGPSLYRKIQAEAIEIANGQPMEDKYLRAAADSIKDAVRYTAVMPENGYWAKGDNLRKALESLGAKTIKDPVGVPLNGYRGRNMAFTLNGTPFEMQVHTELGVAIKDEAHQIYNVSRKLKADLEAKGIDPETNSTYRKMLEDMQAKWDSMPMLKGTPVVQTEKDAKSGDLSKVMFTLNHDSYLGPTIPGGKAALDAPEMLGRARVPSTAYGLDWLPDSPEAKIVAPARAISDDLWNTLPVEHLPPGTPIKANEGTLKRKSIDKVVSGKEPFREGYIIKLLRTDDGQLHVVDGHTRIAMYNALGKDMPVRIMDEQMLQLFTGNDS